MQKTDKIKPALASRAKQKKSRRTEKTPALQTKANAVSPEPKAPAASATPTPDKGAVPKKEALLPEPDFSRPEPEKVAADFKKKRLFSFRADASEREGKKEKKKRRVEREAIFGGLLLVFALIGLISVAAFAFKGVGRLMAQQKRKDEIARQIAAVVLIDPPPVQSMDKLSNESVIAAGIWNFVLYTDNTAYEKDEFYVAVPATDIEVQIIRLFGKDVSFTHQSVNNANLAVNYEADTETYYIPTQLLIAAYSPVVDAVSRQGNRYTVLVHYLPAGAAWGKYSGTEQDKEPAYVKTMQYILEEEAGNFRVIEIKEPEESQQPDREDQPSDPRQENAPEPSDSPDVGSDEEKSDSGSDVAAFLPENAASAGAYTAKSRIKNV